MKKRIFSVILALVLVAALGAATAFADDGMPDKNWYSDGQSTFVLYDAADLLGFKALVNSGTSFSGKTVSLGANIDISSIEWEPIGVTTWTDGDTPTGTDRAFRGTFDGQGHTIKGLTMTSAGNSFYYNSMDTGDYYAYGFFGGIFDATVKNVHFTNVNINCPGGTGDTATQNNTVGAVVGAALGDSTIENVTVSGSVTGVSRTAGIVGYIGGSKAAPDSLFTDNENSMGGVTVKNCVNNAEIKSMRTESSHGTAAGICATVNQKAATSGTVSFEGNKNTGKVEGYLAAGICASTFSLDAASCYMSVSFTGNSNSGSITANGESESNGAAPKASGIAIINDGGKEPLAKTTYTLAGNSNSGAVTANAASDYTQPGNYPTEANRGRSMAAGILVNGAADGRHTVTFSAESANVNSGSITGGDMAAGIVTEAKSGSVVQNVSNSGAVTIGDIGRNNDEASGYYVGGIAAYAVNGAELKGSLTNTGSVSLPDVASDTDPGRYCAGGIVGMLGDEYNGDKDAPTLNGASCVSTGEVSGSGGSYAGRIIGQLRTGEVSNISGEDAIGAVKMVGSREHTVKLTNVSTGELDVVATHNQSFTYTMDLSGSDIGTIDVDGATHTGMTLEISGGKVGTVDLSGVTGGSAKIQFAATNGAEVGTVNAMFAGDADVHGLYVATQAWNNIKNPAEASGAPGSIGEVLSNVGVTVGFVHNHQVNEAGTTTLSDYRVFTNAEGAIGSIATTKTVTTAVASSLVPKNVPTGESYAAPDSNTAASAAYYLASSLDDTAKNNLSGMDNDFVGVVLTESATVDGSLIINTGRTLVIPEGVTLTVGTISNSGTIHNYGTITGEVLGGVVTNYYDVTLDYGDGTVKVVTESGEFTLPTPEREGYSFLGWYDTAGNRYVGSYTPTADVTLTARWSEIVIPDPNPITVTQSANGTISTNFSNASAGTTITVTATPNSGYELAYITVNGEKIDGNTFTMPDKAVTVSAVFVPATGGFSDVVPGAWYVDAVNYVVANGLMEGTSATTFEPDAKMTRAMFWTILARIDGETITGATWADDARAWAMANGVSDGTNPHSPLTREQLVTMLWRYLGEPSTTGTLSAYTDANAVSTWAKTAMAWAVNEGVITGITATTLAPQSAATRAQCATILMRNAF